MNNLEKEKINEEEFDLICEYIKLREESKLSIRGLSRTIGVAPSTIARMEKNLHSMSLGTFTKLLLALNCKLKIVKKGD